MTQIQISLGKRLRAYREQSYLTQKQLADKIGCHHSLVSRVEKDRQRPTPEYLARFLSVLNITLPERDDILAQYHHTTGQANRYGATSAHQSALTLPVEPVQSWGSAPDTDSFTGRQAELHTLKQWLTSDACRLITILGLGGIGKTALAVKLAEQEKYHFEYIIWRSVRNGPATSHILADWLAVFSQQNTQPLPVDLNSQILQLLNYLRQYKCLLVLDNVETLLSSGQRVSQFSPGFEAYGDLFRRLGETRHNSCLLLTSREAPKAVSFLASPTGPVRTLPLNGLGVSETHLILAGRELFGTEEDWAKLQARYSGNPLALKMASGSIKTLFGGDIAQFLAEEQVIFGDVWDLLDQQFERLTPLEQETMRWLAIEREAGTPGQLADNFVRPVSRRALLDALEGLRRRSMIEGTMNGFGLQNVILEFMTNRIIEEMTEELITGQLHLIHQHPLIKATAETYLQESQTQLILAPLARQLRRTFKSISALTNHLKKIVAALQEQSPVQSYAGGNLLNLLLRLHNGHLQNYDFSGLTLWQAHLAQAKLHHVNLRSADLSRSSFWHTFASVLDVAFSPNGQFMALCSDWGDIHLWERASGNLRWSGYAHTHWVRAIAFSPNSALLASASADKTIRLWDTNSGQCFKVLQGHSHYLRGICFSPGGETLLSIAADGTLRFWHVDSGMCEQIIQVPGEELFSLALSPNGEIIAVGNQDGEIYLYDFASQAKLGALPRQTGRIMALVFWTDNKTLACGNDSGFSLWDIASKRELFHHTGDGSRITGLAFHPSQPILAVGGDEQNIALWHIKDKIRLHVLRGHRNRTWGLAFSPDGDILASGSTDQSMRLWDTNNGHALGVWQGYANHNQSISLNASNTRLAVSTDRLEIALWDVQQGTYLKTLSGHTALIWSVAFQPGSDSLLASCGDDETVRLWDVPTGKCLNVLQGHKNTVVSLSFSADGTILASASGDSTVKLWQVKTGRCLFTFKLHKLGVWYVTFLPDGKRLASVDATGHIKLWSVSNGKIVYEFNEHLVNIIQLTVNRAGNRLVSAGIDGQLGVWDLEAGRFLQFLQAHQSRTRCVRFSASGKWLASGDELNNVHLWRVDEDHVPHLAHTFQHQAGIRSLAFSADEAYLFASDDAALVKQWGVQTGQCAATFSSPRPYEWTDINSVRGISLAQKRALLALGAVETLKHPKGTHEFKAT